jgi:hypothetical protein
MKNDNGFTVINPILEPESDKAYRIANTLASIVPAGSNIFQAIFTSPIQNRTNAWMEDVEAKIVELVNRGKIDLEALTNRPEFSAILLKVIQEVEISSQKEKLKGLSNFVINLALGLDIEEDELYIISDMIKSLTPSHIKVLHLYSRPYDFDNRFKVLKEFSRCELGTYDMALDKIAEQEIARILYRDKTVNVIEQYTGDSVTKKDYKYWKLICTQLENLHLIEFPNQREAEYSIHAEETDSTYTIKLKRKSSELGSKLLNLMSKQKLNNG